MFTFFSSIAGFITSIVSFVINMLSLLVVVLSSMVKAVVWLYACIAYLPPFLTGFVVVPLAVAIIFQVINKGS